MRIPFSWLKDFVEIPDGPLEVAQKLERVGVPVERVEYQSPGIKRIFSGKISTLQAHSNADKLRIAQVAMGDTGDARKETIQIVTGAPNVKQGDIIPVAVVGAKLAGGKEIKEAKLRGVDSYGMMCSADELALGIKEFLPVEQQAGVMVLDADTPLGIDLSGMLGLNEAVLVLEPFANRPDYLSVFGVAREASAIYGAPLKFPEMLERTEEGPCQGIKLEIEDYQACSRYVARLVSNVKVRQSPLWMAVRLHAAGVRPINNMVDITNYVLLELGQPLHAFDLRFVAEKTISVRKAKSGEKLKAIDDAVYDLSENMLVIADAHRPIALAGIMGGKESEINEGTSDILLESAHFDPGTIRRASLKLGLRTESSRRFEKGLDPVGADWGSRRASFLFNKAGALVSNGVLDAYKKLPRPREIGVSYGRLEGVMGVRDLEKKSVEKILSGLGFTISSNEPLIVETPSLRLDIHEEIDIIEEVARHYGYDQIQSILPSGITTPASLDPREAFEEKFRDILQNLGLTETITYSLCDPAYLEKFLEGRSVLIKNPLTEDRKALRPFLYPGLLLTIRKNLYSKNKDLSLFEMGKVFEKKEEIDEERHACIGLTGELPWGAASSFFVLKGMLEQVWKGLYIQDPFQLKGEKKAQFHPYRLASLLSKGESFGFLGEVHPLLLESLDIHQPVFFLEMFVDRLATAAMPVPKFSPLPLYPESRRDISMILDERVPAGDILELIRKDGGEIVEAVKIFDVYQGPQVPEKKKSLAFSITYRSAERTLTDQEVNVLHDKIKQALSTHFKALIRE